MSTIELSPPVTSVQNLVALNGLGKHFGATEVLRDVTLNIARGEFVALIGASGCGKSTLLNVIAELESPSTGTVEVPAEGVAFMFQESTLFPWLSAAGNIELALELHGVPRTERPHRVEELLALVRLQHAADKRPHELSGGMRQRVALARALAQDKHVLLMDEPFAALDAITRDILHEELQRIWQQTGRTILFVTHNVREAIRLGQRVVMLSSRPGTVIRQWEISAEAKEPTAAAELAQEMTTALRQEISRHG